MKRGPSDSEKTQNPKSAKIRKKDNAENIDKDIIEAFGSLEELMSIPEADLSKTDRELLKDREVRVVRGKFVDKKSSWVKIIKKSKKEGYIDSEWLFSEPAANFYRDREQMIAVPSNGEASFAGFSTACKIWYEKYKPGSQNFCRSSQYQPFHAVQKFALKAIAINKHERLLSEFKNENSLLNWLPYGNSEIDNLIFGPGIGASQKAKNILKNAAVDRIKESSLENSKKFCV